MGVSNVSCHGSFWKNRMTEPATPLAAAAQQRSIDTKQRAITAIRELDQVGLPVTFSSIAKKARVTIMALQTVRSPR